MIKTWVPWIAFWSGQTITTIKLMFGVGMLVFLSTFEDVLNSQTASDSSCMGNRTSSAQQMNYVGIQEALFALSYFMSPSGQTLN